MNSIKNCFKSNNPLDEYLRKSDSYSQFGLDAKEIKEKPVQSEGNISDWEFFAKNENLPSLADFYLKDGSQLQFYGSQEDGLSNVLVLEIGTCEKESPLSKIQGLTGLSSNPLDVFWALSMPGTPIPEILRKMYVEPSGDYNCEQGWAAKDVLMFYPEYGKISTEEKQSLETTPTSPVALSSDLACSNEWFTSNVYGGFLSGSPFVRLDKTPNNYPYPKFFNDCLNPALSGECWGKPRFQYNARTGLTKHSRVKICGRSIQNIYNDHVVFWNGSGCPDPLCATYFGPKISAQYYWNGKWRLMKNSSTGKLAIITIPGNKTRYISWAWHTSQPTNHRAVIKYAKPLDEFDILIDRPGGF